MTCTQFLGAFNDNLFKQLVLLICVAEFHRRRAAGESLSDPQFIAQALFAVPFVLFSGFAGYLGDRLSKQRIVVVCKLAEILVMLAGMAAFAVGAKFPAWRIEALFVVLFLMSTQSAFFGPSKYGILPELFRDRDLPAVNGYIQMTTFMAIIFGAVFAGLFKEHYGDALWIVSGWCVGIAAIGTMTSLFVRRTEVAQPGLRFQWSALAITPDIRRALWNDRSLLRVLMATAVFWFVGGITHPAANALGENHFGWTAGRTSMLVAMIGFGICMGCVTAGTLSKEQVRFGLVKLGAWGMSASFAALWLVAIVAVPKSAVDELQAKNTQTASQVDTEQQQEAARPASMGELLVPESGAEWLARAAMFLLGMSAGLFVVPLQVFLQARPSAAIKGRMIGAMNLISWIAIVISAVSYGVITKLLTVYKLPMPWIFTMLAVILLPVAMFYRPPDEALN